VQGKEGVVWRLREGRELIDMSGASLTQSLVSANWEELRHSVVTPSSGFESEAKQSVEDFMLAMLPWSGGMLWASSGSDGIEQAFWAVEKRARQVSGSGFRTIVVRAGGYHGNTFLGRLLSTRTDTSSSFRRLGDVPIVVVDEGVEVPLLDQIIAAHASGQIVSPALLLIEPLPTTGPHFCFNDVQASETLAWCHAHSIHVIYDEVACGAYRHGVLSASNLLRTEVPDAVVLSKGLTCGAYPISVAVLSKEVRCAVEGAPHKPLSFTYGLTEQAALIVMQKLSIYRELFNNHGFLTRRRAQLDRIAVAAKAMPLKTERTLTSLRLSGTSKVVSALARSLGDQDIWVYTASSEFGRKDGGRTSLGFMHVCPAFDADGQVIDAAVSRFCSVLNDFKTRKETA